MLEEPSASAAATGSAPAVAASEAVDAGEVLDLARRLIAAPSENPGGDEWSPAQVARGFLADLDVDSRIVESDAGRPSVVASVGSGRPKLAWNGHLDVVPVGDPTSWTHSPLDGVVAEGRLFGRGSADMKGPMASALCAAAAILRTGVELGGTLEFHLVADEEHLGIHGTKVLLDRGLLDADACITGEPSALELGLAQRGGAFLRATARGRAAHGSTPQLGVNAIRSMSRFVLALPGAVPEVRHPLVGGPTINAAIIRGGTAQNVVPAACELVIDRRTIPGESAAQVAEPFDRLVESLREVDGEIDIALELMEWTDAAEAQPDSRIAQVVRAAAGDELGVPVPDVGFTGITDARFYLNDAHIPAVVFGPGDLRVAHTADEHVAVDELVQAARIYARAFVGFLGA